MTNEKAIREKVETATFLLLEIRALLPPPPEAIPEFPNHYDLMTDGTGIFPIEFVRRRNALRERQEQKEEIKKAPTGEEVKQNTVTIKRASAFERKYKKEFSQMPKQLQDKINKAIQRPPRYHKGAYEKRALINGIEIYACAGNLEECEARFLNDIVQKLLAPGVEQESRRATSATTFTEWAELWFEQVFKPNVTPTTFENEYYRYKKHILPTFEKKKLRDILPIDCISFCNALLASGKGRTAESCYGVLNRIMQFAVESSLIAKNPMAAVKPIKSERKNGVPLTKDEEQLLLATVKGTLHEAVIALALYTGLRPCEHPTARIEGDFIVARNLKQKNVKKIVFKKIPITPMLKPFIPLIQSRMENWNECVRGAHTTLKKILPNHRLYDLRTTFATRCQECGVPDTVVQEWLGHKPRTLLGQVYTKFSDDYLLSEGKKVEY